MLALEVEKNNLMLKDRAAARRWLRQQHICDLHWIIKGKNTFDKTIKRSKIVLEEAKNQQKLRVDGNRTVLSVLKDMGHEYSGTGGWWVSAFATQDNHLGFVNTSHGVAISTNIQLSPEVVEALTVPDQGEGNKVSGAAAWTSPDAGEGHKAKSPPGWVQLLVDVRNNGAGNIQPIKTKWSVFAYGLMTCYSTAGKPAFSVEPSYGPPEPVNWYFADDRRELVAGLVHGWLLAACRQIAGNLPNGDEIMAVVSNPKASHDEYHKAVTRYPELRMWAVGQDQKQAKLRRFRAEAAHRAVDGYLMEESWVKRVYSAVKGHDYLGSWQLNGSFHSLLVQAIFHKMEPIAKSFQWCIDASQDANTSNGFVPHGDAYVSFLNAAALEVGRVICHGLQQSAKNFLDGDLLKILYEHGPVYPPQV